MDKHDGNYLTMWFGVYEVSSRTFTDDCSLVRLESD